MALAQEREVSFAAVPGCTLPHLALSKGGSSSQVEIPQVCSCTQQQVTQALRPYGKEEGQRRGQTRPGEVPAISHMASFNSGQSCHSKGAWVPSERRV